MRNFTRMNQELTQIRKLRVAAYCRVSTDEDDQQNSYATQIRYYTDYINSKPDWKLIGIFADEGISGTQTAKRTEYNKMIRMCRRRKIDLILCKSISRFARNTVDCLDYVRELKSLGISVVFEKENINTMSASSEFAISLYASFAQAESESISRNVTWGIGDKKKGVWRCADRLESAEITCKKSASLHEDKLHTAILNIINSMIDNTEKLNEAVKCSIEESRNKIVTIDNELHPLLFYVSQNQYDYLY